MRRVSVVGNSGSGKTTFAAGLADRIGAEHIELDAIHWLPGWRERSREAFREILGPQLEQPAWVVDGNYASKVQDLVWARADTVVVLDLPRREVMWGLAKRTLGRMALGRELWNGNQERWRNLFTWEPTENILRWAWTQHHGYRRRHREAAASPAWRHLEFVFLGSRRDADAWLAER